MTPERDEGKHLADTLAPGGAPVAGDGRYPPPHRITRAAGGFVRVNVAQCGDPRLFAVLRAASRDADHA